MSKKLISILLSLAMVAGASATISVNADENETTTTKTKETTSTVDVNKFGDADGNNKINVKDTTAIQKYLNKSIDSIDGTYADVNEDGKIDVKDATIIQKYITKKINTFAAKADNDWRTSSVGYEIFVRSFYDSNGDGCGDFRGVAEKVDYLKSLGVNVVWLMPFNKTDSYHGYDVTDYNDVCKDYGTMDDFNYMMNTLHDNGIKVVMDLVVNHTSKNHQWFKDSNKKSGSGKYKDYYVWNDGTQAIPSVQTMLWTWSFNRGARYYSCFNGNMPDLNYQNKDVWNEVDSVADFWLDKGIDGFRLDGAMHIDDTINSGKLHVDDKEGSVTHEWWQHFENHVKEKNPNAFCIGEVWPETDMEATQAKFFADLDSNFDFYNMSEIKSMVKGTKKNIANSSQSYNEKIQASARQTPNVSKTTINSVMLSNHDVNRVAYEINQKNPDKEIAIARIKLAGSVQMTMKGMPWIYYGDELGQSGGGTGGSSDPNRREAMDWYTARDGKGATKMNSIRSWSGSERFTKANDGISVEEQENVDGSVLEHYKKLISIRNKYKIFYTGDYSTSIANDGIYGYSVTDDSRNYSMFVIHNNKTDDVTFKANYDFTDELSGESYKTGDTVTVKALTSMIVKYTGETIPLSAN
jgi:alpha-amylase